MRIAIATAASLLAVLAASSAQAQEAGDAYAKVAGARTKLVDEGNLEYETREGYHGIVTLGYFPIDHVAVEASVATPMTTNNIPLGPLAGLPNLGDDAFVTATLGASVRPFKGPIQPYVGGGIQWQFTTQERNGLARDDFNIPNAEGPYVSGGIEFKLNERLGVFAEVRKAWYDTLGTGSLPDPAGGPDIPIVAMAVLDPFTIQLGATAHFGRRASEATPPIETDRSDWIVKLGYSSLDLADELDLSVGGAPFPDAALSTFEHATPSVQVGYFVTPNIAVNATLGLPPKIDIYGGGSIGVVPAPNDPNPAAPTILTTKLGEATYGPTAFTVQYHFTRSGRVRPYVGAGVSYMIVFDTEDGGFQDLEIENDLAPAFEAGVELMVGNRSGLFIDVKKALLRPRTSGTFFGQEVRGDTRLDPWVFTGGFAIHF